MKKLVIATCIAAALTGCAGTKSLVGEKAEWQQGSEKVDVALAPEWFTMYLTKDDGYIYANATEFSMDLQFAIDKATMSAKRQLATQVNNQVESMMKEYTAEAGLGPDADIQREIERTTRTITNTTLMVGFKRDKFEIRREGKGYRVYTRLIFPYNDTNKLMAQAIKDNKVLKNKFDKSNAFKELDKELGNEPAKVDPPKSVSQRAQELPHNTISDAKVKKQVEDAIARGDAVIMTQTLN